MIKAHKFGDYDYIFICDKDTVKEWLKSKWFEQLHEMSSESGGHVKGGDHIPVEQVLQKIDEAEAVAIYTKNVHENHRLTLIYPGMKIFYYNVLEIKREEIDEYVIPRPFCKRCGKTRDRGESTGTGCTPNWDDSHDMDWNFQHKTNEPYFKDHDWNREYEQYE